MKVSKIILSLLSFALLQGCTVATQETIVSPQLDLGLGPKSKVSDRLKASPPKTIAILPLENLTGKEEAFEIVRGALFNHLSSKTFELIKLYRIDRLLQEKGLTKPEEINKKSPQELSQILGADALIYGQITHYDRLYAVLYSQVAVGASLRMLEGKSGELLWEASHVSRKHEGGVSTTAWGIALTAISTAINIRKIELLRASDDLFRDVVKTLPTPTVAQAMKPPEISMLASDSGGTTKKAGEVIKVVLAGDAGCLSSFDVGAMKSKIAMVEYPEGVYVGTYQVLPGDNIKDAIITARLTDKSGNSSEWQDVLGPITIDTTPPTIPQGLQGKGSQGSAILAWKANRDPDLAGYRLYRSSTPLSGYSRVTETEFERAEERGLQNDTQYFYRLTAVDRAGNESVPSAAISITPVAPGPTPVAGEIRGEVTWYAAASPYIITQEVVVLLDSCLTIEPGTAIESVGPALRIKGQLLAPGQEGQGIRMVAEKEGGEWEGLILEEGKAILENCQVQQARAGITCLSGSPQLTSCDISQNATGLSLQGASCRPRLSSCTIAFNQGHGVLISSSAAVEMNQCKINHNGQNGIRLIGAKGTLSECEVAFNGTEGVFCEDSSLEVKASSFHDNGRYHLYHGRSQGSPLSAQGNFWGASKVEEIVAGIYGPVDFSPCLDAPPPGGKPISLPILSSPLPGKINQPSYLLPSRSPYLVNGIVSIEGGAHLHILPGVTIKYSAGDSGILVKEGSVIAKGLPTLPISLLSASPSPIPGD
jgi:hypothetical protein